MNCFRGRSVFLTGHTGFKGSWLALWLQQLGAQVHGYALPPVPAGTSLFEEACVAEGMASHTLGDVRDFAALSAALRQARPEIVFHLAAQALVRASYRLPRETFETNVQGTVNLLEAVRAAGNVRVCQVITSDKCYENRETGAAYREGDPMGGHDPYSASKGCEELVVAAWRRSFFPPEKIGDHGVSLASARAGNVIGGGDWAEDRIMPDCVRALQRGESILVRNPGATRPWQHVLEPLGGYLTLASRQWADGARFADAFNFGPTAAGNVTVREIVAQVIAAWGGGNCHTPENAAAVHEAKLLHLDIRKAQEVLQWQPAFGVKQAVDMTVAWYRQRATAGRAFDARAMCREQIATYAAVNKEFGIEN